MSSLTSVYISLFTLNLPFDTFSNVNNRSFRYAKRNTMRKENNWPKMGIETKQAKYFSKFITYSFTAVVPHITGNMIPLRP